MITYRNSQSVQICNDDRILACMKNVQRMHHSDINPDLLPSFLNVIKSFFHYFSLIIPHSSLLVLSYNSKSPHSAVQKLQHVPPARLCHLHSGL